ncbi:MAG: DNA replication/repair protein RecF, partial [Nevskiaceae bacterium]
RRFVGSEARAAAGLLPMNFTRVAGENFRLFPAFELLPRPGVNLLLGANAAGKTTLLEAVYALGRGKSFRGQPPEQAGAAGSHWRLQGRLALPERPELAIGLDWTPDGLDLRLDHAEAALQDLVSRVAVQVLEPDSHRLLQEGPVYRRRYLDWGVFHVEHRFYPAWRRYQRALKQHNHALRAGARRAEVEAWNTELVGSGTEVQECRERHVEHLREHFGGAVTALLGPMDWSLDLARGWAAGKALEAALADHYEQDARAGKTALGPHRAELRLKLGGHSAKRQVSRGQQKLLIAALLLAQARLVRARAALCPILLVDDFPAELGQPFQQALIGALLDYPGQCFVSSIELTPALARARENPATNAPRNAVFHVEHGSVSGPSLV